MKVYRLTSRGEENSRVHVQPGKDHPCADFCNEAGEPILFTVQFRHGMAEVESNLGQYLLDTGMAQASPIILPPSALSSAPQRTMRTYTAA